ncbi:LuxR family transcriptional regulator [bacterium]|nr:MAG: LuxR family transcriptional regulator [bacterium]
MKTTLPELVDLIRASHDLGNLRARLFPEATQFFDAMRGGLFLHAEAPALPGLPSNPVVNALIARHAPLHEGQILKPNEWTAFCSRADHGHVLVGPLVQNGELVGVIGFTRGRDESAFDSQNVADLSALCLHASTKMASWASRETESTPDFALSPREREIVNLVAQGKTNAQIGRELFVSSETVKAALKAVFRKTGVASRAQLVARLRLLETNSLKSIPVGP